MESLSKASSKLRIKMSEVEQRIDAFSQKIRSWITQELIQAKQQIISTIERAFREQDILINNYIAIQERNYNIHLHNTK